jgi:RNA polymerase sigma factor (sigma-70 family)
MPLTTMPDATPNPSTERPDGLFTTTLWTVVVQAGSLESSQSRPALERLCQAYWYPIYAHIRRRGYSPHDAQDLTQGFFATLLARCPFQELAPEKGRFRSFLLAALGNYLSDERERNHAAKRGGGRQIFSLDETHAEARFGLEPATERTPEQDFDRHWALTVLERALDLLAREQAAAGKMKQFEKLRVFLTDTTAARDYSEVAAALNLSTNAVAVTVRRLRHRYRECVREEIADTLAQPADAEAEMRHLFEAMRRN